MDLAIVSFFNHLWAGTRFDQAMRFVSWTPFLVVLWVMLLVCIVWAQKGQRRRVVLTFMLSGVLFFLVSELFCKHLLVDIIGIRLRPYVAHPDVILAIGKQFSDSSFPSSHMVSTAAILTVAVLFRRRWWPFAAFFILLMAISRMHNGMHYPSDVFVGACLGILCGWGSRYVVEKLKVKMSKAELVV